MTGDKDPWLLLQRWKCARYCDKCEGCELAPAGENYCPGYDRCVKAEKRERQT